MSKSTPTVGLEREPTREDVMAVREVARWPCECRADVPAILGEMPARWFFEHACKGTCPSRAT